MLLLVVLGTAAIFSPTFSQPTRTDMFEEGDYPLPVFRDRNEWGDALERPYKGIDIGHMLRELEAMRLSSWYPRQGRYGKLGDPLSLQMLGTNKRYDGMRMSRGEKRNFDEIDRSGFNGFVKKNFDEIDRSGFNSLVKKNFDEIDRNGFNSFVKRSANELEAPNH